MDLNGIMNILKNLVIFYHAKLIPLLIFGIYLVEIQFKFISRSINKHDKWEIMKLIKELGENSLLYGLALKLFFKGPSGKYSKQLKKTRKVKVLCGKLYYRPM